MHSMKKSALVDFKAIDKENSCARREDMLQNLAMLFVMTHETCSPEQVEIYDNILLSLVEIVTEEARARLASILAPLDNAPTSTVRHLASDTIAVARSILAKSPLLDDIDLQYVCETRGAGHMLAICERSQINEQVTDVMIARGGLCVLRALTANMGARISRFGFEALIEWARNDKALQEGLAARSDFPVEFVQNLARFASDSIKERLAVENDSVLECSLAAAQIVVLSHMNSEVVEYHYDFAEAEIEIAARIEAGDLTEALIGDYASDDRFAHVVLGYARLTGLGRKNALSDLTWANPLTFIIAARALGFSDKTVSNILCSGPWKGGLSDDARQKALSQFKRLSPAQALGQFRSRSALVL